MKNQETNNKGNNQEAGCTFSLKMELVSLFPMLLSKN